MKNIRKSEYEILREATWKRMDVQRNLSLFVATATLTIFGIGFAVEKINKYIFLLPIIILLPAAAKVYQSKKAISCLSAYMIVFLESEKNAFRWETDGYLFKLTGKDFQNRKIISILADMEFFLLGAASTTIYFVYWYLESNGLNNMFFKKGDVVLLIIAIIVDCIIFFITKQFSLFNEMNKVYIRQWNQYALENNRICQEKYIENLKRFDLE